MFLLKKMITVNRANKIDQILNDQNKVMNDPNYLYKVKIDIKRIFGNSLVPGVTLSSY